MLIRTEFGKTIGGYTHYPWLSGSPGCFADADKRTFIFSLDMKEKFVPLNKNTLIYNSDNKGPAFGNYNDINVCNDCDKNTDSYSRILNYNR